MSKYSYRGIMQSLSIKKMLYTGILQVYPDEFYFIHICIYICIFI